MTVNNPISYIEYDGDGTTDEFPITFPFLDEATHIHVYDITNGIAAKTEYVQGTDYTVDDILSSPKVTFTTPPADGTRIMVRRELPITQLTDYVTSDSFPAETHEKALDKLTMLLSDLAGLVAIGDFEAGAFMGLGSDGNWNGKALEINNIAAGTTDSAAVNLAQVIALIAGTVPAPISGQSSWSFTGDASTTQFTLSGLFGYGSDDIAVYVNGVRQYPGSSYAYVVTVSGSTTVADKITFSTAPALGDVIFAFLPTGTANVDATNIVLGDSNVADGSLSADKLSPGSNGQALVTTGGAAAWATLDASYISDFDTEVEDRPISSFGAASADIDAGSQKIVNLAAGTSSGDAVNKAQLDAVTPFRRQTGNTSWSVVSSTQWTETIDFPFEIGFLSTNISCTLSGTDITTVEHPVSFSWTSNDTQSWRSWPLDFASASTYLVVSAARSTISGGTRVTLTLTLMTGGGDTIGSVNNKHYFAAED